jgi:hypothetical protein
MKRALEPIALAMLVATTGFAAVASAQPPKTPVAPVARPAPVATKAPSSIKSPEDRIIELQHHFTDAIAAYARKDYKAAAIDIRKAASYLRLEAGRAGGEAQQELDSSVAQLDTLAASVEKGALKDEQSMTKAFAEADHALALEHRSRAAEAWARKEYHKAGYELKAAAHGLESAAGWVGGEAKAAQSATVADTQALGDKLASGATWTRDEVAKGFELLGNGIDAVGQKIGSTKKASPFDAGA